MKILIAIPDTPYALWQVLVQQNNFRKLGIDVDTIYVVTTYEPSSTLKSFIASPKIKAQFFTYNDTRIERRYATSARANALWQFYKQHPEMNNEPVFYIDNDVLFTRAIDFTEMLADEAWHLSDTRSYIATPYIKSKSEQLLNDMCQIVGVQREAIEAIDDNAGGAQYLMKGVTADFWRTCYIDMEVLYSHLVDTEIKYNPVHPIQSWCADMWVVLWNSLKINRSVTIDPALKFAWACEPIEKWAECALFHNAGVLKSTEGVFRKLDYIGKSPFGKEIEVSDTNCSYQYVHEIKETEQYYSDLIW